MALFSRLDPRILDGLRSQKASILKGLGCVVVTSLLTAAMIPLTERAITAINEAAPVVQREGAFDKQIADSLGVSTDQVRKSISKHAVPPENALPEARLLAEDLGKSEADVRAAIARLQRTDEPVNVRQDRALRTLGLICLGVVGLFALKYWFTRGQAYYLSRAATRLATDLRIRLYAKLQRLPISYFGGKRSGAIQSVLTNDVSVYQTAIGIVRDSIEGPFKAVAALVTIFIINWQLALVALLFVPVLAFLVQRNGQRMKRDQARVQDDLAELAGLTTEAIGGTRVVKAFAAEDRMSAIYQGLVEKSYQSQLRAVKRVAALRPMVEFMGATSLAIILYICGHFARAGTLEIGQIVALTMALDVINQGSRALSGVNNTYNQVKAATERIHREILDVPEETEPGQSGRILENPQGRIEFQDVGFAYPDGTSALSGISFVIEPGESLALVGPSGAGKSTLADLLLRFYAPTSGRILFDGVDIQELNLTWLREQFGVVPQHTFLFAGSIGDNIRLGNAGASEEEIWEAARQANAEGFIQRTDEGLATVLGERGSRISGGEGQRLAIARALVRKPKVLLLDEATSNLDAESERLVTEALDEVMVGRTTLFIVHRLTSAMRATRIMVLRRGEIVETGTPQELLASGGAFAGMMRAFQGGLWEGEIG